MQGKLNQLRTKVLHGVLPAMATPLHKDGYHVNVDALRPLVDFLIEAGVKGLFVGGTTGEGLLLDLEERKRLHECTIAAVNGRVPVLLHVGTNTTKATKQLAKHAEQVGADAIAVITPTFYAMSDDDLLAYFVDIAAAAPQLPMFLYDIPQMAINGISVQLSQRLLSELPTLAGMKTSRPDAQVVRQLIDVGAEKTIVFVGNERIALGSLALGATGLISGLATAVPEPFVRLIKAFIDGDLESAQREQRRINQLIDLVPAGARIGGIKVILQQRGIDVGPSVPPRPTPAHLPLWAEMQALL